MLVERARVPISVGTVWIRFRFIGDDNGVESDKHRVPAIVLLRLTLQLPVVRAVKIGDLDHAAPPVLHETYDLTVARDLVGGPGRGCRGGRTGDRRQDYAAENEHGRDPREKARAQRRPGGRGLRPVLAPADETPPGGNTQDACRDDDREQRDPEIQNGYDDHRADDGHADRQDTAAVPPRVAHADQEPGEVVHGAGQHVGEPRQHHWPVERCRDVARECEPDIGRRNRDTDRQEVQHETRRCLGEHDGRPGHRAVNEERPEVATLLRDDVHDTEQEAGQRARHHAQLLETLKRRPVDLRARHAPREVDRRDRHERQHGEGPLEALTQLFPEHGLHGVVSGSDSRRFFSPRSPR